MVMAFTMNLPTGTLPAAALDAARLSEHPSMFNHSIRSFLFARLLAHHEGVVDDAEYNEELLFAATVLHDLGTGTQGKGEARFEVEGADLAAGLLTDLGMPARNVDLVWEAIAVHTSDGLAGRRGLLARLTSDGVFADFGFRPVAAASPWVSQIHDAYPRLKLTSVFPEIVIAKASESDAAAPPWSLPGDILREHQANGITSIEINAQHMPLPWSE
jgi:hypothetical protein